MRRTLVQLQATGLVPVVIDLGYILDQNAITITSYSLSVELVIVFKIADDIVTISNSFYHLVIYIHALLEKGAPERQICSAITRQGVLAAEQSGECAEE